MNATDTLHTTADIPTADKIFINDHGREVLSILSDMELSFDRGGVAKDLTHLAFIAKSEYNLGQLSTKIELVGFKNLILPIASGDGFRGRVLYELFFHRCEEGFVACRFSRNCFEALEVSFAARKVV